MLTDADGSILQAVQLTVNRMDWLGENALRPWAVAWRAMAEVLTYPHVT